MREENEGWKPVGENGAFNLGVKNIETWPKKIDPPGD